MITMEKDCIHLSAPGYSYLMELGPGGIPMHLYFGPAVKPEDAAAFRLQPGLGWGCAVMLPQEQLCLDWQALEWSGSGRGDYRESPLELGEATDFRCTAREIREGIVPMTSGLPQARGGAQTLVLTLEQPGARLTLYYTAFETAVTRRAVLENTGDRPLEVSKLMSFCLDLPGKYTMTTFSGGWISETRRQDAPVGRSRLVNESLTGASSNRHNPGFLLSEPGTGEDQGMVYGFNLIYSGNHYGSAQCSAQGLTRVMQGINPANFRRTLAPGARFETPEAVLAVSDRGFNGLSAAMHAFVNAHIVPEYWQGRPRPVLYNSWEGCLFHFSQHRLLDLADRAKKLGCELFVLDDGWFGDRNSDRAGLGDYRVNTKKLPQGIAGLGKQLRARGLQFGLWFEPESVNPDSDLYRAHPDWALTDGFPDALGRNQLHLDLAKEEVRDYIVENVSRILDEGQVAYVKWDMNRHSIALGANAHSQVLGLYDILRRIFTPRPGILLEGCSSGGNRFDLGMLCYAPQIWCSDNTDPIERLDIQGGLSYLYPQSTFGAHVSAAPHSQTLRHTPLNTRGNVSFFGCLGYELDLKHLNHVETEQIQKQIAFYKAHRETFQYGTFRRTEKGWQVSREGVTLSGVFYRLVSAAPGYEWLKVPGLDPEKTYRVTSLAHSIRLGQFGNLLKYVAPVNIRPDSLLLRAADSRFTLKGAAQALTASGQALARGIPMAPLFRGTGYEESQRTQADFGSDLFVITES